MFILNAERYPSVTVVRFEGHTLQDAMTAAKCIHNSVVYKTISSKQFFVALHCSML